MEILNNTDIFSLDSEIKSKKRVDISYVFDQRVQTGKKLTDLSWYQVALLNIYASLLGFDGCVARDTQITKWTFRPELSSHLKCLLDNYTCSRNLIDSLRVNNLLDVAVSNSIEEIKQKTSHWSNFSLDEEEFKLGRRSLTRSLYTCVNIKLLVLNWSSLGNLFEGSESVLKFSRPMTEQSETSGSYLQISSAIYSLFNVFNNEVIDTNKNILCCRDEFGYFVGSYFLTLEGHRIEVRLTDLNENLQYNQEIGIDSIINSHSTRKGFREVDSFEDGSTLKGFAIKPIEITMKNPMKPILGAELGDRQVVGAQTEGYLQINNKLPLNYNIVSVESRSTSLSTGCLDTNGYYLFFQNKDYRTTLYMLVEILIDDQLIFYSPIDENNISK